MWGRVADPASAGSATPSHKPRHVGPQRRQQLELEPRIALQPVVVPLRRVRHRHEARTVAGTIDVAPLADGFGQPAGDECRAEMPLLRILADKQDEFEIGQAMKQSLAPSFRAFAARRQVAAFRVKTRKAESHRHDRNFRRIVEYVLADTEPLAQADAGRIGVGAPRGMNPNTRRLTGDAQACGLRDLEDGPRLVGQANAVSRRIATEPAGANLVGHWIERRAGRVHGRPDIEAAQTKQALGVA